MNSARRRWTRLVGLLAFFAVPLAARGLKAQPRPPSPPPVPSNEVEWTEVPSSEPTAPAASTAAPPAATTPPPAPAPSAPAPSAEGKVEAAARPEPAEIGRQRGLGLRFDLAYSKLATPPSIGLATPAGAPMNQLGERPIVPNGALEMVTLGFSTVYRTGTPLTIPLLGVEFGLPTNTGYPGTVEVGPAANAIPWTKTEGSTYYVGLDILGVGLDHWWDQLGIGVDVRPGFRYLRMTGTLTQDLLMVDSKADKYSFSLRAEAQFCIGKGEKAAGICVFGGPRLFEFREWINGFNFGLRITGATGKARASVAATD